MADILLLQLVVYVTLQNKLQLRKHLLLCNHLKYSCSIGMQKYRGVVVHVYDVDCNGGRTREGGRPPVCGCYLDHVMGFLEAMKTHMNAIYALVVQES